MAAWHLTDQEWEQLQPLLAAPPSRRNARLRGGRPRLENDRRLAEACLFRHFHSLSEDYRAFGWNDLPKSLGVSSSTANRRFREWSEDGRWLRFWDRLMQLRRPAASPARSRLRRRRGQLQPVQEVLQELERAYVYFNRRFFADTLTSDIALAIERPAIACGGYFCSRHWRRGDELMGHITIATAVLGKGAAPVLAVLLHEMVHLRNDQYDIADCDPKSQYHNRHFRDVALLAGLECAARHPKRGYGKTMLGPRAVAAIHALRPDERAFDWSVRRQ